MPCLSYRFSLAELLFLLCFCLLLYQKKCERILVATYNNKKTSNEGGLVARTGFEPVSPP